MAVLILTERMSMGYGVPLVVAEIARRLQAWGLPVVIGCRADPAPWPGLDVRPVLETEAAVTALAESIGAKVIIAHSSPFFELLPALAGKFKVFAHDHGDVTPALFDPAEAAKRQAVIDHKQTTVYPALHGVIAISDFIRRDIAWPDAIVIPNGCDHVPDPGPKSVADHGAPGGRPLKIGALMRLGSAEAHYKGGDRFIALVTAARATGLNITAEVIGRGSAADAAPFIAAGITVRRNVSDAERDAWLREIDVLIAPSRWEGFNLPLVEAQARGTAAIAYDAGAQPEVAPVIVSSRAEAVALLQAYDADRALLTAHAAAGWRYVRQRFRWTEAAAAVLALIAADGGVVAGGAAPRPVAPGSLSRLIARIGHLKRQTLRSIQQDGWRITCRRIGRRLGLRRLGLK